MDAALLELNIESTEARHIDDGRLKATLSLRGEPYWYGEQGGLDWTWVDLLLFLGRHWPSLVLEQSQPLPLNNVPHPGKLLERAQTHWEDLSGESLYREEAAVFSFLDRHNLSFGMPGANLPMLLLVRSGAQMWLVDEDQDAEKVRFEDLIQQLDQIGEQLARAFAASPRSSVREAVTLWQQRNSRLQREYTALSIGLDESRLVQLKKIVELPEPSMDALYRPEPAYYAAARMARHQLSVVQIGELMQRIAAAPHTGDDPLASLSHQASTKLEQLAGQAPFEQGYQLARWFRDELSIPLPDRFDPEHFLVHQGVRLEAITLDTSMIDAIACWGAVDALVILNQHPQARAARSNGRRSTLAHELCHLLVDRERAFPVAEVLGGDVDTESEKRANAFAAEVLLPQEYAAAIWRNTTAPHQVVRQLADSHGVSFALAAHQLLNAQGVNMTEEERVIVRAFTQSPIPGPTS